MNTDLATEASDNLFESELSSFAIPDIEVDVSKARFGTRKSRFWFKLESLKATTEKRKVAFAKKVLEHADHEVENRFKTYNKEIPKELKANMATVREFFLSNVAPLTLATTGGTDQAHKVIKRLIKADVDTALLSKFENMANRAATVKMALFVLSYFDLPPEFFPLLFSQKQPEDSEMRKIMDMLATLPKLQDMEKVAERSSLKVLKKVKNDETRRL